jgi:hypothetical protein
MDTDNQAMPGPLLLPLRDGHETYVLCNALVAFADALDAEGDTATAQIADAIAARVRPLDELTDVDSDQILKVIGIGRYKGRRQG